MTTSIGNDVVDLALPGVSEKNRDRRFVKRVFSDEEAVVIDGSADAGVVIWSFWSAKETAFKILMKLQPDLIFSPKNLPVSIDEEDLPFRMNTPVYGNVSCGETRMKVRWDFGNGFIHCVGHNMADDSRCMEREPCGIWFSVVRMNDVADQSRAVRALAREMLSDSIGDKLEIVREPSARGLGPPTVQGIDRHKQCDISLSHDGRFAAAAVYHNHPLAPDSINERPNYWYLPIDLGPGRKSARAFNGGTYL